MATQDYNYSKPALNEHKLYQRALPIPPAPFHPLNVLPVLLHLLNLINRPHNTAHLPRAPLVGLILSLRSSGNKCVYHQRVTHANEPFFVFEDGWNSG